MNVWTIFFGTLLAFTEARLWMLDPFWLLRKNPNQVFVSIPLTYAVVGTITKLILIPLFFISASVQGEINFLLLMGFMVVHIVSATCFYYAYSDILFGRILKRSYSESLPLPQHNGKVTYVLYRIFDLFCIGLLGLSAILAIF